MEGNESYNSMFLVWWYTEVRHRLFLFAKQFLYYLTDLFSVRICLVTFFAPWKRDKVSYAGLTIQARLQVALWNLVSRFVGAAVKGLTLITYLIVTAFYLVFGAVMFLVWLLFPFIVILIILHGIRLILL